MNPPNETVEETITKISARVRERAPVTSGTEFVMRVCCADGRWDVGGHLQNALIRMEASALSLKSLVGRTIRSVEVTNAFDPEYNVDQNIVSLIVEAEPLPP